MFFYLLIFILVISVTVFVHEFGHYFFAKIFGIKVEEFSIGFGKEIFFFNDKSGTKWKFCILPIGGYLKMLGDIDQASAPNAQLINKMNQNEQNTCLHNKPIYQRALVAFGGPLANFIFATCILFGFYISFGKLLIDPIVSSLDQNGPAYYAGLKVDDRIVKINNKNIKWLEDINKLMSLNNGEAIQITVLRNEKAEIFTLKPEVSKSKDVFGNNINISKLGIFFKNVAHSKLGFFESIKYSVLEVQSVINNTLKVLGQMIIGQRSSDIISGPLRIAKYSGQSFDIGFAFFMWFVAMISINLGLVNLFPIPMLDGGHLLFYFIEAIKGGPISPKYQEYATKVGLLILASIFLFATLNDIFFIIK